MIQRLIGLVGLAVFVGTAWLFSEDRKKISWRLVSWGIGLQIVFALLILKTKPGYLVFKAAKVLMTKILEFSQVGSEMLFGVLATETNLGAQFAFQVLPVIIFTSSLMALLYYFKIIPAIVRFFALIMKKTMRASGMESFSAALFIFMGIEAITALKEYLKSMTRSELFVLMTAFMSTIAGSVMAVYTHYGAEAGHLLAASVMSAPAAVALAKIMIPEMAPHDVLESRPVPMTHSYQNPLDALATGASDGLKLAATIGAMLIAFVSVIALINAPLESLHLSLEQILGYLFTPFAFLTGVPWAEAPHLGELLGIKTVFNEFLGYVRMQDMIASGVLSPRSVTIATYALCGFANFGSLAILIGGVSTLAPVRKPEVVELGLKALIAGTLAKLMTASLAGLLI